MRTDRAARVAGEPPGKLECGCVCVRERQVRTTAAAWMVCVCARGRETERQVRTTAAAFTFAAGAAGFAGCFLGCCCWFGPPPPLDWDEAAGTEQNSSETK